jgi:hypothetical protein
MAKEEYDELTEEDLKKLIIIPLLLLLILLLWYGFKAVSYLA